MKKLLNRLGFTLIELLVVISIIAILASLAVPAVMGALTKGQMMQTLNNGRQLHIATQQMALDATTTGDTNLGWPGDTGNSWASWSTNLVPSYMSTNDFAKMISAPGVVANPELAPNSQTKSAVKVYGVKENNDGSYIFLTSANYTFNTDLSSENKPYGDKGFIVFRKAGDGAVLLSRQAKLTNLVGTLTNTTPISGNPAAE